MEELGELIIAIIILVVVFAVKLIEMASRKKMPLPLPEIQPEEEFFSEVEIKPEPEVVVKRLPLEPEKRVKRPVIEKPAIPISILSRDELERGIILSTILGPPKSLFRLSRRIGKHVVC